MNPTTEHEAVLVKEVIHYLRPRPGKVYVDATLGSGGHALAILMQLGGEGLLIGSDTNLHAVEFSRRRIAGARIDPALYRLAKVNFADLGTHLKQAQSPPAGGILLDLGPSTPQLLNPEFGLSWQSDESLDMRLSPDAGDRTAADIVNDWSEAELARLFRDNADERWARRIARRIVAERAKAPIRTGRELGRIVGAAIPRKAWPPRTHPATRVFLALRIAVNREFENLEAVLPQAVEWLEPGGRLVVISFHSGEDARVKRFMRRMARPEVEAPWPLPQKGAESRPRLKILTPKPVTPSEEEVRRNPRSRSARLRAAEKL